MLLLDGTGPEFWKSLFASQLEGICRVHNLSLIPVTLSQNFEVYSLTCLLDYSDSDNSENLFLKTYFKLWFFIQNWSQQYFAKHFQDKHAEYYLIPAEPEIWPTSVCTRSLGNIEACF